MDETPKARVYAYEDDLDHWFEIHSASEKADSGLSLTGQNKMKGFYPAAALALFAFIIVFFMVWKILKTNRNEIASDKQVRLAVLQFENLSGEENLKPWCCSLPSLIITELSQSLNIKVVSHPRLLNILNKLGIEELTRYSEDDLRKIAKNCVVDHLIYGSLLHADDYVYINYKLLQVEGCRILHSATLKCENEKDIISSANMISLAIKNRVAITPAARPDDRDTHIVKIIRSKNKKSDMKPR